LRIFAAGCRYLNVILPIQLPFFFMTKVKEKENIRNIRNIRRAIGNMTIVLSSLSFVIGPVHRFGDR
jgi:hypothetical protein